MSLRACNKQMWPNGVRDAFLRALVLFGTILLLITELLGAAGLIRRAQLFVCWIPIFAAVLIWITVRRRNLRVQHAAFKADPVTLFCGAGIVAILFLTAVTAAFSPPNSADAMAYHMPRVVYWAEQGSIRFFPTPFFNQIMLPPLAEYFMLHTYVLSGGDRFINFVQWFASLASIVGVSSVAKLLGSDAHGQAMAALFCATVPAGILAGTGAKNDYFMAMWLVAAVYFGLRSNAAVSGLALGLALLTKATAYLFAPWLVLVVFLRAKRTVANAALFFACAIAVNAPHYIRNYGLSASILGFDSAHGDGYFRWRNETFGWKQTVSNFLRNASEQLAARSEHWNQGVYNAVIDAHRWLGIDPNDPATTWRSSAFSKPINANHEANAPNRWQLLILAAVAIFAIRDRRRLLYTLALLAGFVSFCAYLKWQPFQARLLLPLFILGSALVVFPRPATLLQLALCAFLLNNARPYLFENWIRPLKGPRSVLQVPRDAQYFADLREWKNEPAYWKTVDLLGRTGCQTIGIDISTLTLEYPLQALLRERNPNIQFVHTGVKNVSTRYAPPVATTPCAVACLDCIGDTNRLALYSSLPKMTQVDKFAIFTWDMF